MKKETWKKTYVKLIILAIIPVAVLIIAEGRAASPDYGAILQSIFLSILCSIAASALFSILQDEGNKDLENQINEINENLKRQKELYDSGIRSIRKKSYYDEDGNFWKKIVGSTSSRLDLVGHSISKWFDEEYKDFFAGKIEEMLKNGKEVRIILSGDPPDMEKVHSAEREGRESFQLGKMENTCYELRQIVRSVPKPARNKLKVYLTKLSDVTYMYIRTDRQCFISPYIYSETNKSNTFLLELRTKIDYSKCFDDDFQEMLRDNPQRINLED